MSVMAIPTQLLWNVRIDFKQKVGLVAIFSLTIITMTIAIMKVEITLKDSRGDDVFYFLCTTVELTVCKPSRSSIHLRVQMRNPILM